MRRTTKSTTHLVRAVLICAGVAACQNDGFARSLAPTQLSLSRPATQPLPGVQAMATWNVTALRTTLAGPFSPPRESRNLAIVFAAVNDAVCSITRACDAYARRIAVSHHASIEAAVGAAALAALGPSRARDRGVAVGKAAAAAVLAMRAADHSQDPMSYTPTPGLGSWVPTAPAFAPALEPEWGAVTPFLIDAGSQFRPPAPPVPGSDAYVRDYLEIVTIGV